MSIENAIDWLKIIKATLDLNKDKDKIMAINMAIESLQEKMK